ncbi:ammonia-dependent NAD(+) synthetase [Paenibacillus larvae]|uniref:NH(3)-dependent NAD(+) synthetase n=4 Tax=Paenibacillus larvae TaxID=1464 RepID=V9W0J6_9BACL|nr:ammonia-dependent NAD(+) synthetase [Paenibacillus larvae]AHD04486.1 NH(3)-dependent NAD(+) ligase [Paenibacillus larvae subsp. larvae DSM 25430]AQR78299.1 NAD(+) synthetase [Paenibacillus larvae subsp. larvae]AQT84543.1 NAD(+) synthetase [Paenibacillus larvae subsp. pulvifaciens]AQZ46543.1 NAD(+) synthetase [Paenibacillus larvae subsp. pulvifaciens]ARF67957.1 NAD(+) synthetase [Paenibacillus larvae subsp. pulvifaciens]
MGIQQDIIRELGVKPTINVDEEIRKRVDFLKEYVLKSGANGLLIAISGGVDSAVATGLCKRATDELSKEKGKEYKTVGVFQPYGVQEDIEDSYATAKAFGLSHTIETNIEEAVNEIALEVEHGLKPYVNRHMSKEGKGNIKARTRMVVQYAIAFELNLLVVGTDHASEAVTGFYTKWGDGAVDITPLSSLNKRQVRMLARELGVPSSVLDKAPTAGLWEGQTDEKELGISYEDNSDYLEGKQVSPEVQEKLERQYVKTAHKRNAIPGI